MSSNAIARMGNASPLDQYEERIKELHSRLTLANLKATIDEECGQNIPQSQYRKKIQELGLRKYRKTNETDILSSILTRRLEAKKESKVLLWGEQVPQGEIKSMVSRSRPSILVRLCSIRPPRGYRQTTTSTSLPRLMIEARDPIPSSSDNTRSPRIIFFEKNPRALAHLKAVLPFPGVSYHVSGNSPTWHGPNLTNLPLSRQLLFQIANGFPGIDEFSIRHPLDIIQSVNDEGFLHAVQQIQGPTARSIIQNLFKASIESGHHAIIHFVLSRKLAGIDVNKERIFAGGFAYTPLEQATRLRHSGLAN
ncbi:hypothetical protein GGR58DRAFT_517798 [Xylaria digitata]|nr:hypothetical protein GGR58DRAFT_517798 [Xylaria digitata]